MKHSESDNNSDRKEIDFSEETTELALESESIEVAKSALETESAETRKQELETEADESAE